MEVGSFFLSSFAALFSVMDPIGAIPLFLALTAGAHKKRMRENVNTAIITVAVSMVIFFFIGTKILSFFGISLPAFKTSGGLLILFMAISMLNAEPRKTKQSPEEAEDAATRDSIAVVPLAIPMLMGPGAMSAIVLLSDKANTTSLRIELFLAMATVVAVTWVCLSLAQPLRIALGESGIRVATRVMGLIVAALAIQFMADGILELFPGLKGT